MKNFIFAVFFVAMATGDTMGDLGFVRLKIALERLFIFRKILNIFPRRIQLKIYYFFRWPLDILFYGPKLKTIIKKEDESITKRKRILFLLGDPARDMMTYSLLEDKLSEKYYIQIINHLSHRPYVKIFRPDLIIVSETRSMLMSRAMKFAKRKLKDIKILTLHGEGAINPAAMEWWSSGIHQDWEMVWGKRAKKILMEYGEKSEDQIIVTGNPRFDYHKNPISKQEYEKITGIKNEKKCVLLATNFLIFSGRVNQDFDFDVETYIKLREVITEAFTNIAMRHPEIQFIIKLHPSEVDEIYTATIQRKGIQNIEVYCKEAQSNIPINYFLPFIDVLVHWSSTTSTEAWMYEKPTISTQFLDLKTLVGEFVQGSIITYNEEELEKEIMDILSGKQIPKEMREFQIEHIEDWYGPIDGQRTNVVVNYITDILENRFPN